MYTITHLNIISEVTKGHTGQTNSGPSPHSETKLRHTNHKNILFKSAQRVKITQIHGVKYSNFEGQNLKHSGENI